MATIYEVSKLAGVSLATISRVINGTGKVSEKTSKKVRDAIRTLDYRPSSAAKSLASNRSDSIGVLVSEFHGPFYGAMMSGIESELRAKGKHGIFAAGHSDEASEKEGIEFLINRSCDALILHVEAVSDAYLIELSKGRVPFVLINRFIPELSDICISLNNDLGGYLSARAMLDSGHTHIAYVSGPFWKNDSSERLQGFRRALEKASVPFDADLLFEGDYHEESGREALLSFSKTHKRFTAVACANDEMASGVYKAARELGLSLPEDLSVIGFDHSIFASYLYPQLSSVNYPIGRMGKMAARLVLRNIYKATIKDIKHEFEPELVSHGSIAQPK